MKAETLKKAKEIIKSKKYMNIKSEARAVAKIFDTIFDVSYCNVNDFLEQMNSFGALWHKPAGSIHKLSIDNLSEASGNYYAVQVNPKDIALVKIHEDVQFPVIHSDVAGVRIITISNKTAIKSGTFISFSLLNNELNMNLEVLFFIPYSKKSTKYMIISDNVTTLPIYFDEVGSAEKFRIPTKENLKSLMSIPKKINAKRFTEDEFIRISSYCGKKMSNILDKFVLKDKVIYEFMRIFNSLDKNWTKKSAIAVLYLLTGEASYFENYTNSKDSVDMGMEDDDSEDDIHLEDSLDKIVKKYEEERMENDDEYEESLDTGDDYEEDYDDYDEKESEEDPGAWPVR